VHFKTLKSDIWRLVPILLIFLRINEHTGQLLVGAVGPNALWPSQPNFWEGHRPCCSDPMEQCYDVECTKCFVCGWLGVSVCTCVWAVLVVLPRILQFCTEIIVELYHTLSTITDHDLCSMFACQSL